MKKYIKSAIQPIYTLADWVEQHKNDAIEFICILDATDNSPEDKLDEDFRGGRTIFDASMSELISGEIIPGRGNIDYIYSPYECYEVVKEIPYYDKYDNTYNYELIVEELY